MNISYYSNVSDAPITDRLVVLARWRPHVSCRIHPWFRDQQFNTQNGIFISSAIFAHEPIDHATYIYEVCSLCRMWGVGLPPTVGRGVRRPCVIVRFYCNFISCALARRGVQRGRGGVERYKCLIPRHRHPREDRCADVGVVECGLNAVGPTSILEFFPVMIFCPTLYSVCGEGCGASESLRWCRNGEGRVPGFLLRKIRTGLMSLLGLHPLPSLQRRSLSAQFIRLSYQHVATEFRLLQYYYSAITSQFV